MPESYPERTIRALERIADALEGIQTLPQFRPKEPRPKQVSLGLSGKAKFSPGFEQFWAMGKNPKTGQRSPRWVNKTMTYTVWRRQNLESKADEICKHVTACWKLRKLWQDGYEPGSTTYLRQYQYRDPVVKE